MPDTWTSSAKQSKSSRRRSRGLFRRKFEYAGISGLSREMQETLARVRPQTLGQASRIPGVTPAALSLLHVHLEVGDKRKAAAGLAAE